MTMYVWAWCEAFWNALKPSYCREKSLPLGWILALWLYTLETQKEKEVNSWLVYKIEQFQKSPKSRYQRAIV